MKYSELMKAMEDLHILGLKMAKKYEVSFPSIIILMKIHMKKLNSQKELVEYMCIKKRADDAKEKNVIKVTVSNAITELMQVKLIEKNKSEEDKRVSILSITKKGMEIINEIEGGNYG